MSNYVVRSGETIVDVILNATGNLMDNWSDVLDANSFTSWTPTLYVGQVIIIPDNAIIQPNILNILKSYPSCNNSFASDLLQQISNLIAIFTGIIIFRADNNFNARADSTVIKADANI